MIKKPAAQTNKPAQHIKDDEKSSSSGYSDWCQVLNELKINYDLNYHTFYSLYIVYI